MKIAIIGPAFPYRGGISDYNNRMAQEFQSMGHEVIIHTFKLQYPAFLFPGKTQYSTAEKPKDLQIERSIDSTNPLNWIKVGNSLRKENFDLVIIRFWLPFMGPSFGTILKRIQKNPSTKVIALVDNIIPHESRIGDRIFTQYFVNQVDGFMTMSQNVYDDLQSFDQKKPKMITPHPLFDNYGDPVESSLAKAHLNLDTNQRYILFFGLIRDYKGLDLLLEAFADKRFRNKNIKLIIAGEYYSDKDKYIDIIKRNQLENEVIQVDQFIDNEDVKYYFSAADVVAQPYKAATQSGVTQIAYHFNKPMLVTNVGGLKEICPHGKVGYVVEPEPKAIANALYRFFEDDNFDFFIKNIKQEKKKYGWDKLIENLITLKSRITA